MEITFKESEIKSELASLWNIETPSRVMQEREKAAKVNQEIKQCLDSQVRHLEKERAQSRENDIKIGKKMIDEDLDSVTRSEQLAAFKRHEMTKQLREAWTQ